MTIDSVFFFQSFEFQFCLLVLIDHLDGAKARGVFGDAHLTVILLVVGIVQLAEVCQRFRAVLTDAILLQVAVVARAVECSVRFLATISPP